VSQSGWHDLAIAGIAVCWAVWGGVWLVGAVYNARRAPRGRKKERTALGTISVLAAVGTWLVLRRLPAHDWGPVTVDSPAFRVAGLSVLAAGTAFTLWARAALGTMWSASAVVREHHVLRTEGPYGITRHPIYTGMLAMLVGTALADGLGRWLALIAVVVIVLAVKIHDEEELLSRAFPRDYARYRRRVPLLLPGLKRLSRT
jgi:protein-S-isoprenylcysteine O-methyltransferase Ste14